MTVFFLDRLYGPNIESAHRIKCKYVTSDVYTSQRVYKNVHFIEFDRFSGSVLNLETFPNVNNIYISDISEDDPCKQVRALKDVNIISGEDKWTCSVSLQ